MFLSLMKYYVLNSILTIKPIVKVFYDYKLIMNYQVAVYMNLNKIYL